MIWESTLVMTVIDLAVVIMVVLLASEAVRRRDILAKAGAMGAAGLGLGGLFVLVLFHLADFYIMWVLPALSTPERAAAVMQDLHLNWAWMAHFFSFLAVMAGVVLTAHRLFALVERTEELSLERDAELLARRASRSELEASRDELEKTQRMAHLGGWRWDLKTRAWTASPELLRILTLPETKGPMQPDDFRRLVSREELERLDRALEHAIAGDRRFDMQLRLRPAYQRAQVIHTVGDVIRDDAGVPTGMVGMTQDVTESALATEELRSLNAELEDRVRDRTAELESFMVMASHDIKAPLRVIQAFVDAATEDEDGPPGSRRREYLARIRHAASRLHQLVEDLVAYSRLGHVEVRPTPVDLNRVLERVAGELEADFSGRGGKLNVESPLAKVMGQRDILSQVVNNLLSNAAKFVDKDTPPLVRVWTEDGGDRVRLWVEDNGIGLRGPDQKRIFDVFERLHSEDAYPGTGLGLAIVQRAMERMRGSVGVESLAGKGSRFWVELPRAG